jgi:hypothetical protein
MIGIISKSFLRLIIYESIKKSKSSLANTNTKSLASYISTNEVYNDFCPIDTRNRSST